jgi:hypothetical protein
MIDQKAFAEAARHNDAMASEYGIEEWLRKRDIDQAGLLYIIKQRALRAAMIVDGQDPTALSRTEMTTVQLSDRAEEMMEILQAAVLDGIAIGITAKGNDYGQGNKIG